MHPGGSREAAGPSQPTCCNPYDLHGERPIFKSLREIKVQDVIKNPRLVLGDFWCDNCRCRKTLSSLAGKRSERDNDEEANSDQRKKVARSSAEGVDCSARKEGVPICCNPYGLHGERQVYKNLRVIKDSDLQKNAKLLVGESWCDFCRKTVPTTTKATSGTTLECGEHDQSIQSDQQNKIARLSLEDINWSTVSVTTRHSKTSTQSKISDEGVCCNPYQFHEPGTSQKGLRKVNDADLMRVPSLKLGDIWCASCRKKPLEHIRQTQDVNVDLASLFGELHQDLSAKSWEKENEMLTVESDPCSQGSGSTGSSNLSPSVQKVAVSYSLREVIKSPLVTMHKTSTACVAYSKRKLEEALDIVRRKLCRLFNIPPETLVTTAEEKAKDLDILLSAVREKLPNANRTLRYQLLSLVPLSWKVNTAASYFGVGRKLLQNARDFMIKNGILAIPFFSRQHTVLDSTKEAVKRFYCSDEYSKIMPGKKDCISVERNTYEQKRLVLSNLRELYEAFKVDNASLKIGFSIFSSLRPKWCIIAGAAGTHTVCVCQIHQNLKLTLHALQIKIHYREVISKFVCSIDSRTCMLHLCNHCHTADKIEEVLRSMVLGQIEVEVDENGDRRTEEDEFDFLNEDIVFNQWKSTDRCELVTQICTRSELLEIATEQMMNLMPHDFIARKQAEYVKRVKETLSPTKCVVLMDFSMNYSCLIQEEAQSHHWSKRQVTLHPCVVYYKDNKGDLVHKTIMCLSDDLEHDVALVKKFQERTVQYLKDKLPIINEIEYVSDGCGAQYKNKESFKNLCQHEKTFGLKATHTFFATSHGKSQCDGDAGTVKRILTKASLQRPRENQINTAEKVHEFCMEKLSSTYHFEFVRKSDVDEERKNRTVDDLVTVPGTRSFHHFAPLSDDTIGCKRLSQDEYFSVKHCLSKGKQPEPLKISNGDFVVVRLTGKRFIAYVTDFNEEYGEADISLLWPKLPSSEFSWPPDVKTATLPLPNVLCKVSMHELPDNKYSLTDEDKMKLRQLKIVRKI